jgi:hypothetical protein
MQEYAEPENCLENMLCVSCVNELEMSWKFENLFIPPEVTATAASAGRTDTPDESIFPRLRHAP